MGMSEDVKKRREEILEIAASHGVRKTRIFGSVARGEDTPESDIDFLVEFEPDRSLIDQVALINDLEELLGRKVDVVTEKGLHWFIRDDVLREAISL